MRVLAVDGFLNQVLLLKNIFFLDKLNLIRFKTLKPNNIHYFIIYDAFMHYLVLYYKF